jgi:hypothetical protein
VRHYLFLGPSGSGKTTTAIHLLRTLGRYFDFFAAFSPTDTTYNDLCTFLPSSCVFNRAPDADDVDRILQFMNGIVKGGRRDTAPRLLLFMDDCSSDEGGLMKSKTMNNLYSTGRHSNISIWVTAQTVGHLHPSVRAQSHRCFFMANPTDDRSKIHECWFTIMPRTQFLGETKVIRGRRERTPAYFDVATQKYRCLVRLNIGGVPLHRRVFLYKAQRDISPAHGGGQMRLPYGPDERLGAPMLWHVSNAITNMLQPLIDLDNAKKQSAEYRRRLFSLQTETRPPVASTTKRRTKTKGKR